MKLAPRLKHEVFWEAFWDLGSERINGMSLGQIPRSKMHWYAETELSLTGDAKDAFVWIMRKMDIFFMAKSAPKHDS